MRAILHASHAAPALQRQRAMVAIAEGTTIPRDESDTGVVGQRARSPSAPLIPGERYEMGPPIGRGGMGEVLVAHDVQIGRYVAIKRLRDDDPSPGMLSRFLREARIQGRLEHPAIPPVYELNHDANDRPYFAMRKLEGVSLGDTLRDPRSPFTRRRLLNAFVDVCNAIELAHSRGVIHLDLKPSNILLGKHVIDWGIAREIGATPERSVGTPGYMAPEQIRANIALDERVDVYALGCLLFEILTGRPLHPRGLVAVDSALRGATISDDDMPIELAGVCRRATAVVRDHRIASARELADAVQCYLDGDRDTARRRELAREHLDAARDALATISDEELRRSTAMREAGRALALDPALPGAAELVGTIMLEPPNRIPKAVAAELAALERQESEMMNRFSRRIAALFLALPPGLALVGIRDVPYLTVFAGIALVMLIVTLFRSTDHARLRSAIYIFGLITIAGLFGRMFTPFLLAPGVAAVAISSFAFNPFSRIRRIAAGFTVVLILVIVGLWLAEVVGLLSKTTEIIDGKIVLTSPLEGIENIPALPLLCVYVVALLVIASLNAHRALQESRRARQRVHVQAWHLRQLLR
jgi:serine/threonine-protein kinase